MVAIYSKQDRPNHRGTLISYYLHLFLIFPMEFSNSVWIHLVSSLFVSFVSFADNSFHGKKCQVIIADWPFAHQYPSINSQWTSLHLKQWSYVSLIPWDLIAGPDVHTSPPQAKSLHREKAATLFIARAFLCIFVCILLQKKWKHCFNSPQCWVNKHSKIGWWIKFLSSVCLCVPSCTQAWKRHKTSFRHKNANLVRTVSLAKKCNTLPGACIQFWISN